MRHQEPSKRVSPSYWYLKAYVDASIADLYIVGIARFNFASLPDKNVIKRETSKGVKYNRVDYTTFLTPNPSSMLFEYLINNESYGKTEIKY